jgi:pyridoxine 5-phosphate synthase
VAGLGVNIDHVATVRQARRTYEPDPIIAAGIAEMAGADQITVHLREDRRHIQDRDVRLLRETIATKMNLECACVDEMLGLAIQTKPEQVCLVPEKREEVTTEGGMDVHGNLDRIKSAVYQLAEQDIIVTLFIDPDEKQIDAANQAGAHGVELHTGTYANARGDLEIEQELCALENGASLVLQREMLLDAGHGLNYHNVIPIAKIPGMRELNIGHSIISRSIFVGLEKAVREMKELCMS